MGCGVTRGHCLTGWAIVVPAGAAGYAEVPDEAGIRLVHTAFDCLSVLHRCQSPEIKASVLCLLAIAIAIAILVELLSVGSLGMSTWRINRIIVLARHSACSLHAVMVQQAWVAHGCPCLTTCVLIAYSLT